MLRNPPPELPSGAPVVGGGRYRLVSKLGEGGMAAVYRAWDTRLRRWRAVKVLLPEYARRPRLRARFENEAALMARIDHPHVVAVDDVVTDEALPFIVMELADGGSLADWSELYGPMPPRLAAQAAIQICEGVAAAHEIGVIHRDLKPHNVILTSRGVCRVTDFGIARVDGTDLTQTGSVLGTLGYMAPEQRADASSVDLRADVYAVGATLYALLKHAIVPDLFLVDRDPTLLDGVAAPLRPILRRALAYAPDARWPDTLALARALREILPLLPPDPVDTPALAVPPEGRRVSSTDAGGPPGEPPDFSDIAPLVRGATPDAPARVLPYIMPERDAAPYAEPPSWLADTATVAPREGATDARPTHDPADRVRARTATPSPARTATPSQARTATPSPARTATPSPARTATPSPARTATPSPARRATPAAAHRAATPAPARHTVTPAPAHRSATPAPARRTATPAPAHERDPASLDAAENLLQLVSGFVLTALKIAAKPLAAFAVPVLGLGILFGLTFGGAALRVRAAEGEAAALRDAVYAALDDERRVVDDLVALGASRSTLEAIQSDFTARRDEPERYDSALRLVNLLDQETRRWAARTVVDPAGRAESARQRVARLRAHVTAYEEALRAWEEVARDDRAAMAIQLGCARGP